MDTLSTIRPPTKKIRGVRDDTPECYETDEAKACSWTF